MEDHSLTVTLGKACPSHQLPFANQLFMHVYCMLLHLGGFHKDLLYMRVRRVTSVCSGECGAYVGTGVVGTELLCNSVSHAVSPAGVPWQGAVSFPFSAFTVTDVYGVMT